MRGPPSNLNIIHPILNLKLLYISKSLLFLLLPLHHFLHFAAHHHVLHYPLFVLDGAVGATPEVLLLIFAEIVVLYVSLLQVCG